MGTIFTLRLVVLRQKSLSLSMDKTSYSGTWQISLRHSRRPRHLCVSQRTTCRSSQLSSTMWLTRRAPVLGDEHLHPLPQLAGPQSCFKRKSHFLKVIFKLCYITAFHPATSDLQLQRTGYLFKVWSIHPWGHFTAQRNRCWVVGALTFIAWPVFWINNTCIMNL